MTYLHVLHAHPPLCPTVRALRAGLAGRWRPRLAVAQRLCQLGEVDLGGGLAHPVSGLLGNVQVTAGVVIRRFRFPHSAVGISERPAGPTLSDLQTVISSPPRLNAICISLMSI